MNATAPSNAPDAHDRLGAGKLGFFKRWGYLAKRRPMGSWGSVWPDGGEALWAADVPISVQFAGS